MVPEVNAAPELLKTVRVVRANVDELTIVVIPSDHTVPPIPNETRLVNATNLRMFISSQVMPVITTWVRRKPVVRLPNKYHNATEDN